MTLRCGFRYGAMSGAVAVLVGCGALAPRIASAEELRVIASSADWQVVMADDPFADPPQQCQVRTRTANAGGRRERPEIIFDVTSQRITVRPDLVLQGSLQANRRLQGDSGDQGGQHQVAVRHGIRVDGGKLYSLETRDLGSNNMDVQFGSDVYAGIAAAARDGKMLNYLWSIETSRRAFQFPLDGLRVLLPDARASCGALAR